MSADDWRECPKGCEENGTTEVMRIDHDYGIDKDGAYFRIDFHCQVCDLHVHLEQTKKPKTIVTDIAFD